MTTKPTTISEVLDDVYAPQIMNNDTCLECGINFTQARDEALTTIKQIIEEQVIGKPMPLTELKRLTMNDKQAVLMLNGQQVLVDNQRQS